MQFDQDYQIRTLKTKNFVFKIRKRSEIVFAKSERARFCKLVAIMLTC